METEPKNSDTVINDPGNTKYADGDILRTLKKAHESRDIKTIDSILKKLEELCIDF
ncbi:MAG: hypothetical protein LBC57_00250 [Treponema sp.]|jgi:hypothetical protein|nr:hypothetical protein [Treponema sp.]